MNNMHRTLITIVAVALITVSCGSDSADQTQGGGVEVVADAFFTADELAEIATAKETFADFADESPYSLIMVMEVADVACETPDVDLSVPAGMMESFLDEDQIRTEFSAELESAPIPGVTDEQAAQVTDHVVSGVTKLKSVGVQKVMETAVSSGWCEA
ncbi:MAG: hypothetical protein ACR2P0_11680 [Acidimicrobiales bacterium]